MLEPIHDFTKILSGSQWNHLFNYITTTTCSIILPAVYKLTDYFANFKSESNNRTIMNLANKLKESFNRRCEDFLKIEKLYAATYLDPRFRTFKFISNKTAKIACTKKAHSLVVRLSHELQLTPTSLQLSNRESSSSQGIPSKKRKILLCDKTMSSEDSLSVDDEIINYLNMKIKVSENSGHLCFFSLLYDCNFRFILFVYSILIHII